MNFDQSLLYKYPLSWDSVVFDVGGYKGDWTAGLLAYAQRNECQTCHHRELPDVYIFEPIHEFAGVCIKRFKGNPKVHIWQLGFYENEFTGRVLKQDSSSAMTNSYKGELAKFQQPAAFCNDQNIKMIDLMSINIEGAEYPLLMNMIESGFASRVRNIQVQFHNDVLDAERHRAAVRFGLASTHEEIFCEPFMWEAWRLK